MCLKVLAYADSFEIVKISSSGHLFLLAFLFEDQS